MSEFVQYCRAALQRRMPVARTSSLDRTSRNTKRAGTVAAGSLAALACGLVVIAVIGCRGPDLAPATNGIGGALSPTSVRQYAQQRGISNEQARYELQQKVSQHDEEQAVENIDQVGAKLR